jgi:hypothetical protein
MGKRQKLDPAITEKWATVVAKLSNDVQANRAAVKKSESDFNEAVRDAFSDGVQAGPLAQASGLSTSRLFQIKHA